MPEKGERIGPGEENWTGRRESETDMVGQAGKSSERPKRISTEDCGNRTVREDGRRKLTPTAPVVRRYSVS